MSGFSFNSQDKETKDVKPAFSYTFGQPSGFEHKAESKEMKSLFSFGTKPVQTQSSSFGQRESKSLFGFGFGASNESVFNSFASQPKETKKVKKQLSQEELDKKIQLKEERKKAKAELDKIKIQEAIKESERSYQLAALHLKEIEKFYDSLDKSQSIFILSDIRTIYHLAKNFTEKARVSYNSAINAKTVRTAEKNAKNAQFAESIVFENYTKMRVGEKKSKYSYKISHYTSSNNFIKKKLSEEEKFELLVDKWFKGKKFEQAIRHICEIIDSEKINNIILSLKTHGNVMKAYKELSLLMHSDKIERDSELTDFEKFKYNTVYKLINLAKAGE